MQSLMEGIAEAANKQLQVNEGDFYEDGFLICGTCKHRKQFRLPGGGLVRCNCACDEAAYQQSVEQRKKQDEADRISRLRSDGITSQKLCGANFAADDGTNPAMRHLHRYAIKWKEVSVNNIGLLLYGDVGTGKSFGAACIANDLMERNVPALMTNFSTVLNSLSSQSVDKNEYIRDIVQYPLLILDDFGIERSTEYALEQVFNVVDSRYRTGKPLIITTNLSLEEIKKPQDTAHARIYERILEMCVPVNFGNQSRRGGAAAQKFREASRLLWGD